MLFRKTGIGAVLGALALTLAASPALAEIKDFQLGFQQAASPVMVQIESFHMELVWIITAVSLFVLGLLVWVVLKFRASVNPTPSKVSHNVVLEVAWTIIPVIILVVIAIPSFKLLYLQHDIPKADVSIRARLVCDWIANMTDHFAFRTYRRLFDADFGSITDFV